jgi:transposase
MHYCGMDVSLHQTAICVVDGDGVIVSEAKLASAPEVISAFLTATGLRLERIGLEAGSTAAWLQAGLRERGWPAICIDARHAAATLQAGLRNKNDRNDARGLAQIMRLNAFRPVWVTSRESQRISALFTARNTVQDQLIRIENVIRGLLRCDGISIPLGRARFEAEVRERIEGEPKLLALLDPLLAARAELLTQRAVYDRRIDRQEGSDLQTTDDRASCGASRRSVVQGRDRRPASLPTFAHGRRSLWLDPTSLQLRRDRLHRPDQQGGRSTCEAHVVRGGTDHVAPRPGAAVHVESVGA